MLASPPTPGFHSVGQHTARTIALNAARRGRLARTFLVHGPAGAGKGAFVEDLLALLFCTAGEDAERPCNACAGCRGARSGSHPDLVTGSPERWRELRGTGESIVAVARRWLGEASGAPIAGERRVVLVEGADRAGEQIQNAMLKALEEPGDRQVFILVADEPSRLLPTIRSRCQPLRVGRVPRRELAAWLVEQRRIGGAEADSLARIADGLTGRALAWAADRDAWEWRIHVQRELLGLLAAGQASRLASVRELLDDATRRSERPAGAENDEAAPPEDAEPARTPTALQRGGAILLVEVWLALARDLLVVAGGQPDAAAAQDLRTELLDAAGRIEPAGLASFVGLLERVHEGLGQNAAPRLALDVVALSWPASGAMNEAEHRRMRARVSGRVQGVGFRWWARRQAEALGLVGWVVNRDDERSVDLLAEGPPQALDALERLLHQGPPGAWVDSVDTSREAASGEFTRFSISRS